MRTFKSQSAMEYLMTYGWAILIIAVVLGALFQLGVFNSSSFSPRAPPGACQVFRPSGPGTTTNINLMGVCTGQLPQYVAQFNGASGYVNAGSGASLNVQGAITVAAWIKPNTIPAAGINQQTIYSRSQIFSFLIVTYPGGEVYALQSNNCGAWNSYYLTPDGAIQISKWAYVVASYDSSTGATKVYMNGVLSTGGVQLSGSPLSTCSSAQTYIGERTDGYYFNGSISNLQVYNVSLTANQIQALYLEGIGGAPIKLQNIMGWWPLNGNANDYSGNGNNGVPTAVTFTSQYGK